MRFGLRSNNWSRNSRPKRGRIRHFRVERVAVDRAWPLTRELAAIKDGLRNQVLVSESLFFFQQRFPVAPCAWIGNAAKVILSAPLRSQSSLSQLLDAVDQLACSDRLPTAKEVVRLLSISEKTVYCYVSNGLIPTTKFHPRSGFGRATWEHG